VAHRSLASAGAAALIRTTLERGSMAGSRFRALATVVFFMVATQSCQPHQLIGLDTRHPKRTNP
jgi:hypothetical protein